ncbi:hypothetical protein [Microbulbifer spongiae]|uniref:DUF5658 domain-containing protein n=1 Tax=Microbulbifer spongiae TaxID=2944933 RepID=A0ABY9EEL7_9GAMM|nr:hypothetical protein [Microbulbifer sp. MI-G]WKD49191.1 hypothetical protein M8T91_15005 [Microbulbifer sp. MI-G]
MGEITKLKIHEKIARYMLGIVYLFGAIDGFLYIFFDIKITGNPTEPFLAALKGTLFFWIFMKLIQAIGAFSLLFNYRPALGFALLMPISAVLCMYYLLVLHWYYAFTVVFVCSAILLRAYLPSYKPILMKYS